MPRVRYRYSDSETAFEGVIPRSYATQKDILEFLQSDQADLKDVKSIRYRAGSSDTFVLLNDESFVKIDDGLSLLLIKASPQLPEASQPQSLAAGSVTKPKVSFSPMHQTVAFNATQAPTDVSTASAAMSIRLSPSRLQPSPTPAAPIEPPALSRRDLAFGSDSLRPRVELLGLPSSPASAAATATAGSSTPSAPGSRSAGSAPTGASGVKPFTGSGSSGSAGGLTRSPVGATEVDSISEDRWIRLFLTAADLNNFTLVQEHHLTVPGDVKLPFLMERLNHPRDKTTGIAAFPSLRVGQLSEHYIELQGIRTGLSVWQRLEQPQCTLRDARYILPTQVAAFRFLSALEKVQDMPEVAWARPVGSGCRVFRTRNRIVYIFRVATVVTFLDVEQPGPELDLGVVEEVAEMVYQRVRIHLGLTVSQAAGTFAPIASPGGSALM